MGAADQSHSYGCTGNPEPVSDSPDTAQASTSSPSPPNLSLDIAAVNARAPKPGMTVPDAKTREETQAKGAETFGPKKRTSRSGSASTEIRSAVGVWKSEPADSRPVQVSGDRLTLNVRSVPNSAHSFIYDFAGIRGQGYFAVFDGHAGKHAAEWCGEHFHEHLLESLRTAPATPVPDLLNTTFHRVDTKLSQLAAADGTHSGCTAVVAFLRLEDEDGNAVGEAAGVGQAIEVKQGKLVDDADGALRAAQQGEEKNNSNELERMSTAAADRPSGGRREDIKNKIKAVLNGKSGDAAEMYSPGPASSGIETPHVEIKGPADVKKAAKRTLYTANVGDARAVLSRKGKAVRLTYDHKGSDAKEAKRITDAGGFVMNNRVNGVLAVTRSLGDSSMKEFVVGSPYTTETTLGPDDDFLIVACDGVSSAKSVRESGRTLTCQIAIALLQLWDVCQDQEAVDTIRGLSDPQEASKALLDYALQNFSSDNLSVLVVALSGPHSSSS
ncbi:BZ3500_MvSof-1268-A1-R1_Chr5-1g07628 [Microbotryum saponariae]|uniref:BZ3500_MvSof-1268-A1-R1_Chr5-1g07628 protein n=1 Tax=Microbotryum saponariae TaxID=289078 RepID=A0A2X0LI56_9BASI|nr:BZ3500_MvSof-1268-A1-R1_Chr5-1g07628 [Microbotryum saponariae]SDA05499.1 BZ3501_MvSof-1269-A2-R1_Chr5-2g07452 [Microbotryum saponariae]